MRPVPPPESQVISLRGLARPLVSTWPRRMAWLTAIVVVAVTAFAGGFAAEAPAAARNPEPGEWVEVGPVRVAVTSWAVRSDVDPESLEDVDGADAWLVVEARVASSTGTSEQYPDRAIELPADIEVADSDPDSVVLLRDGSLFPDLQPGLPERVALLWPVRAESAPDGDNLEIDLRRLQRATSQVDGSEIWRTSDLAGTVTVPRDRATGDELIEADDW